MKIVDGIYQVDGINGNVYLVEDGDKLILIDTGLPRSHKKIIKYIESFRSQANRCLHDCVNSFSHRPCWKRQKNEGTHKCQGGGS